MTTAHRATFNQALGGDSQGGTRLTCPSRQYSSKDLPGYRHMDLRGRGQDNAEDLEDFDYKEDLLRKEKTYQQKLKGETEEEFNETHDIPTIKS